MKESYWEVLVVFFKIKKGKRENKVNYSIVINIEKREYWYKKCYI